MSRYPIVLFCKIVLICLEIKYNILVLKDKSEQLK